MKEFSSSRDDYSKFEALDAEIIGISANHTLSQKAFADLLKLPFPLLSDFPEREVMKRYGVLVETGPLAGLARRSYFLIDKKGTVRWKKILENPRDLVSNEELLAIMQQIHEDR